MKQLTIILTFIAVLLTSCGSHADDDEADSLNKNIVGTWWPELSESDFQDLPSGRDYLLLPTFFIDKDKSGKIVTYKYFSTTYKEYSSTQLFLKASIDRGNKGLRFKFYYMEHMQSWLQYNITPISDGVIMVNDGNGIQKPRKYIKR